MKACGRLLLLIISLITLVKSGTFCNNHAYVGLFSLNRSTVESLLDPGFSLPDSHPLENIIPSKSDYPVIMEFGQQNDCKFYLDITKHSFIEFKLEIPFVNHKDGHKEFLFKPLIYVDKYLDAYGSKFLYGLKTLISDMSITKLTSGGVDYNYSFKTEKGEVNAEIKLLNFGEFVKLESLMEFEYFRNIADKPWYCYPPFRSVQCASMNYDWKNIKIRPIEISVNIKGDILGAKLSGKSLKSLDNSSAEFYILMESLMPHSCPKDEL